jgi:hypothetical protein
VNRGAATISVLTLVLCSASAAAGVPRVHLDIDPCFGDATATSELEHALRIELGDAVATGSTERDDVLSATVRCDSGSLALHVDDPVTHRSLWRRLPRPAEPRLVALALVELIVASGTELGPLPSPPPSRSPSSLPATPAAEPTTAESPPPAAIELATASMLRAQLTAGAMRFSAGDQTLAGIGLRVSGTSRAPFGWMIDAQTHRASQTTMLGELSTDLLSLGAAAQLQLGAARTRLDLGVGARGGAVRVTGMPSGPAVQGSSFSAKWFGPLALANLTYALTEHVALDVAVECGYVVTPVRALAGDETAMAIDGAWMQLHAGFAVRL